MVPLAHSSASASDSDRVCVQRSQCQDRASDDPQVLARKIMIKQQVAASCSSSLPNKSKMLYSFLFIFRGLSECQTSVLVFYIKQRTLIIGVVWTEVKKCTYCSCFVGLLGRHFYQRLHICQR